MPVDQSLTLLGIVLIVLGFLAVIAGSVLSGEGEVEAGGVVFIGPIPIVFGSNRKTAAAAAGLGVLVLLYLAVRYGVGR